MKFGKRTFSELEDLKKSGLDIEGIHHDIHIVCCCDWKAGACIEGLNGPSATYFCRYCYCTKEQRKKIKG